MRSARWFNRQGATDAVLRVVRSFEVSGESGWTPLERYWAGLGSRRSPSDLAALIKVDLRRRFENGESPRVLDYLERYPILAEDGDRVISLIYEEFCFREENGEAPDSRRFCDDYALWRDSLWSQLAYHRELSRAIGAEAPSINFPDPGERFDKYRLTSVLGEGGVARVYLATEEELGGRQLAIKVSASFGQEPSILAKLDHRNIVPILTVAESESGLRGICMPYRPGLTLEEVIRGIGRGTPPRSAGAIVEALRPAGRSGVSPSEELRAGWAEFPIRRTFPEAVAWIGLALSNALAYLHEQGVFHRDIKPANILLAYREGPQLLDFNLAQEPSSPERASVAQKGGTLPYMAPEQLKAFLDPSAWDSVEEAADVYSLGLVLRELLTGRPPELPTSSGSLPREIQSLLDRRKLPYESIREINPGVPPGLDSIIGKCLAFRPDDRYLGAKELADDLQCFLDRRPLLNAPNSSKVERVFNWIFRNRQAVVSAIFIVAAMVTLLNLSRDRTRDDVGREFREAESLLESDQRSDWLQARTDYESLHQRHPETARSSLGLALTLKKLGVSEIVRANKFLKEASGKPDAEQVILSFLKKEPNSALLLLNLGIVRFKNKQPELAIEPLKRSIAIQPGIMGLVVLGNSYQQLQDGESAIKYQSEAMELALNRMDASAVHETRLSLMHGLVDLIDRKLRERPSADSRHRVETYWRQLGVNILGLEDDWAKIPAKDASEIRTTHRAHLHYFEGCRLSIRGHLDLARGDSDSSDSLFEQAAGEFKRAREAAPEGKGINDHNFATELCLQELKLNQRRDPGSSIKK